MGNSSSEKKKQVGSKRIAIEKGSQIYLIQNCNF
jgi:hypothetical protein